MSEPLSATDVEVETEADSAFPEPFHGAVGAYELRRLSEHFGLTHFGANFETLPPGSQSALRHWHSDSDELVLVLEGQLTLITDDGEKPMREGMCVGFPAGVANAHHLVNRSSEPATFLVVGSRSKGDWVHYPDDDIMWIKDENGLHPARKDGTRY